MAGPQFFETRMGATFYSGTMPKVAKALERIADSLERQAPAVKDGYISIEDRVQVMWQILHTTAAKSCADAVEQMTIEVQQLAKSLDIKLEDIDDEESI